jgi:hypothetical protein
MQKRTTEVPSQMRLGKGQSYVAQLPRGTVVRVASGAVAVVQRIALDHFTMVQQTLVRRGGLYRVDVSGWVEFVAAQCDAELFVLVPQTTSLAQGLRNCLGGWLERVGAPRKPDRLGGRAALVERRSCKASPDDQRPVVNP